MRLRAEDETPCQMMVRILALVAFVLIAVACTSSGAGVTPLTAHSAEPEHLYVLNAQARDVTVYDTGRTRLLRTISEGLSLPETLAVDTAGTLYVADGFSIVVYRLGDSAPLRRVNTGYSTYALAFDASQNLYAAEIGGAILFCPFGELLMYPPKLVGPAKTVAGAISPGRIAFDSSGKMFVTNMCDATVQIFSAGGNSLLHTIRKGVTPFAEVAVDASGNLYVANTYSNTVAIYAPGATIPTRTITQGLSYPRSIAFDRAGNLYVANFKTIAIYAPGQSKPARMLTDGIAYPDALATDSAGNLYVANRGDYIKTYSRGNITMYAPGGVKPLRTIAQGVNDPSALAIGP